MKRYLFSLGFLILGGLLSFTEVQAIGLNKPEDVKVVVGDAEAQIFWTETSNTVDVEGYQIEVINEPAGTTEVYQVVDDTDGTINSKATISLANFADDALLKLRIKSTNVSLGDSSYSDEIYLKRFPKTYIENFESLNIGNIDDQNGWEQVGGEEYQVVQNVSEDGKVLKETDGGGFYTSNQATQGSTSYSARVRYKTRRTGSNTYNSPVLWIQGQGDRTDSGALRSPRYGFSISDDIGSQYMTIIGFDDLGNSLYLNGGSVTDFSFDFTLWHYIEIETINTEAGLLIRGTLINSAGEIVSQLSVIDTDERVTATGPRSFYGLSSSRSSFEVSEVHVWADDFRVPPTAPTEVLATRLEEGLGFNWSGADFGGATFPEGKYEVMFEQVGGGVTQTFEVSQTTFTRMSLNPDAQYRLMVRAVNDEFQSTYTSSVNVRPKADQNAPAIQNVTVEFVDNGTKAGSFRVRWETSEPSQGRVTYGFQENSTLAENNSNFSSSSNTFGTDHAATLTKLAPCTKYRGRIRVRDESSNLATSPITFTTKGCVGNAEIEEEVNDDVSNTEEKEIELREDSQFRARLRVPANATNRSSLNFQIKRLTKDTFVENVEIPDTLQVIAEIVNFSALEDEDSNVSEFDEPIEITIAYDDTDLTEGEEQSLVIYRYGPVEWFECEESGGCIPDGEEGIEGIGDRDGFWTPGEEWEQLTDCSVDTSVNTVTCTTTRFSEFTIMKLFNSGGEEPASSEEVNTDSAPENISESIPDDQPNTYTNRPFANLSQAVSRRNIALNEIENETAASIESSDEDDQEISENQRKRDDQNRVAENITNLEEDIQNDPMFRWYIGGGVAVGFLLLILLAWLGQRRRM